MSAQTHHCVQLLDHFASVEDSRIERTKEHLLINIIAITICALICGADSSVAVENYGNVKRESKASSKFGSENLHSTSSIG